jgi:hypothetical protein
MGKRKAARGERPFLLCPIHAPILNFVATSRSGRNFFEATKPGNTKEGGAMLVRGISIIILAVCFISQSAIAGAQSDTASEIISGALQEESFLPFYGIRQQ